MDIFTHRRILIYGKQSKDPNSQFWISSLTSKVASFKVYKNLCSAMISHSIMVKTMLKSTEGMGKPRESWRNMIEKEKAEVGKHLRLI